MGENSPERVVGVLDRHALATGLHELALAEGGIRGDAVDDRLRDPRRVRMRRIPNAGKDVLTDFVLDHIERGAEVRTDGWGGYNEVGHYRFSHVVTNVSTSGGPAHLLDHGTDASALR